MTEPSATPRRWRRIALRTGLGALVGVAVLAIPECPRPVPTGEQVAPFAWDRDALWLRLQARRDEVAAAGCTPGAGPQLDELAVRLDPLRRDAPGPEDPRWDELETRVFETAAVVAACGDQLDRLLVLRGRVRRVVKDASRGWPVDRNSRDRLYRLLYGTRAAIEEVLLAVDPSGCPRLERSVDEPAATPSAMVQGVRIHSGDLLLSRGGAPTSAFIARGSDHPGNFSHVALVHVDESGRASAIEAHIERGVAVADVDAYFADKKLRIAVLRLRADHPALVDDPMLPHRAATEALEELKARHIPYDFTMDVQDDTERFCSEVASVAYRAQGVQLWQHLSTMSSPGLARWMAGFGVEHLRTHGPSDLEYDPQLRVVAEWHDPQTLLDDHLDNAVIDAMLEQAEAGAPLEHDAMMLPVARLAKAYSVVLNLMGKEGPVPEGMSATTGLRVKWLGQRHARIERGLRERAQAHRAEYGRWPAYWALVALAREVAAEPS